MYVRVCVCMHASVCIGVRMFSYVCVGVCVCVRVYVRMCACVCVCVCVCECVHVCMRMCDGVHVDGDRTRERVCTFLCLIVTLESERECRKLTAGGQERYVKGRPGDGNFILLVVMSQLFEKCFAFLLLHPRLLHGTETINQPSASAPAYSASLTRSDSLSCCLISKLQPHWLLCSSCRGIELCYSCRSSILKSGQKEE